MKYVIGILLLLAACSHAVTLDSVGSAAYDDYSVEQKFSDSGFAGVGAHNYSSSFAVVDGTATATVVYDDTVSDEYWVKPMTAQDVYAYATSLGNWSSYPARSFTCFYHEDLPVRAAYFCADDTGVLNYYEVEYRGNHQAVKKAWARDGFTLDTEGCTDRNLFCHVQTQVSID